MDGTDLRMESRVTGPDRTSRSADHDLSARQSLEAHGDPTTPRSSTDQLETGPQICPGYPRIEPWSSNAVELTRCRSMALAIGVELATALARSMHVDHADHP